jgi:hypothetical protein
MLRITLIPAGQTLVLKLEGRLLAPWCEELRAAAQDAMSRVAGGAQVSLDTADVWFVDADGAALLRTLLTWGITVDRSSAFVAELLLGHGQQRAEIK